MPIRATAVRLTVHLSGAAMWHHRPAYVEIVHRALHAGLAGASAFRAVEGYGRHLRVHREHVGHLTHHDSTVVVIVDDEQRVREFLADLADILELTGVAVVDAVEVHT
jgi:PII-like signaling protein